MLIHEMSKAECQDVLTRTNLGRLACVRNNQPYIVPIYFDYDGDYLYSFATLGQKIQWMRTNPRVCDEVDNITDRFHWTTVVAFGRYQEIVHAEQKARAQELFKKRPDWWYPAVGKTSSSDHGVPIIFRIQVDKISGRRAARDRAKLSRPSSTPTKDKAPAWWTNVLRPRQK